MPQTYSQILLHVVFSTKDRMAHITPEIRASLHAYIGGIVRNLGGTALAVGGTADHVHALLHLPPDCHASECVRTIKANASKWIHERWPEQRLFSWQNGYAAFSVSRSNADTVVKYIASQEEHHRNYSFREEFVALLQRHGIPHDERFLWS